MELASPFSEAEEIELAAELLYVANLEEVDRFLGRMVSKAWKGIKKVGRFVGKSAKPLGGVVKGVAKAALPFGGGALGSLIGSASDGALSKGLDLESGELEQEDHELKIARGFVRIAGTAARQAALADPNADLQKAARAAVMIAGTATCVESPGQCHWRSLTVGSARGYARTSRWVRHGRSIMLLEAFIDNIDGGLRLAESGAVLRHDLRCAHATNDGVSTWR